MKTRQFFHLLIFSGLLLALFVPFTAEGFDGASLLETGVNPGPTGASPGSTGTENLPGGDWLTAAQQQLELAEYNLTWQEGTYLPGLPAAYQAPNRLNGFRVYFTPQGLSLIPRSESGLAWQLGLILRDQNPPELVVEGNHIDYRRDVLIEWYTNEPAGLRQGFTFDQAPANGSALQIDLAVSGSLVPSQNPAGDRITFSDAYGNPVLYYGSAYATDAAGVTLPVQMELVLPDGAPATLRLNLDSAAATFPISLQALLASSTPEAPAALPSSPSWSDESDQAESRFGWSASTAGDVNGDGFSDVIVGAYGFDSGELDEGKAFLYYGSETGLSTTASWTAESNQASAALGFTVAPAGDVNGDGYWDVLLGAHAFDNPEDGEGAVFLWYGSDSGLGPDGTPANADWRYENNVVGAGLGVSLGMAGDVNGDGFSDLTVGMHTYDHPENNEGGALAFHGSAAGPGSTPDWSVEGNQVDAQFGKQVSAAGDVNGDGYADVIVGTEFFDNGTVDEGAVWVYHGSASGLSLTPSWFAESNQGTSRFGGYSNTTAGDVNGDGYSDIIVGAKQYDSACAYSEEGAAFVWLGSAAGLGANGNPGNVDWKGCGNSTGYQFGSAVGTAGDVNGDGYADVVIGCFLCWVVSSTSQGGVYLYYGSANGLGATGTPSNSDWYAHLNALNHELSYSVGSAGDVNGDGYSDVIAGDRFFDHGELNEGGAFVWHGSPDGLATSVSWRAEGEQESANLGGRAITAGDVNGDGFADVVISSPNYDIGQVNEGAIFVWLGSATGLGANGTPANADWMAESNQENAYLGYIAGAAGDVNGDGYGDLITGAYSFDNGNIDEGIALAWYGSDVGLGANGDPSNADWKVEGGLDNAHFGQHIRRAGDVNGDGYSDVIMGVYQYSQGQTGEGVAYLYHGSQAGLSTTYDWMAESNLDNAGLGISAGTAGDVNGDGFSDIIIGAWGYAEGQTGEGLAFVWLGSESGLGANGTPANADWKAASDQVDANFGRSVASAGDVNGDGYSDVIVGSQYYDNVQVNEGAAFVWLGSNTGLGANGTPANADWMAESNQADSDFGLVVGGVGDVNGDGATEVIVGARYYDNGQSNEGMVFVWYGSPTGLGANGSPSNPDWKVDSGQVDAYLGYGGTGEAGDVNGDGYGDVIVASSGYDGGMVDEGGAFLFYGNLGAGLALTPQQQRSDGMAPVGLLGVSNSSSAIQLRLTGRMPLGRQRVRLEWQIAPLGLPFNDPSAIHGVSSDWTDSGVSGVTLSQTIGGLAPLTSYHWRVRLLYAPNRMGQVASRWLHLPWHSFSEKDFQTSAVRIYLPVTVRPQ